MGGTDATANIGLGNVAVYEPCFFCDLDVNCTVVGTMPSPLILLLLLLPFGTEVISTVEHSRPLAKNTRLVIGLITFSSDVEYDDALVDILLASASISTAMTGWTCEL
jgi:hypothetical protein